MVSTHGSVVPLAMFCATFPKRYNLRLISEKRILPFAVILVGAIYAAFAAIFYLE